MKKFYLSGQTNFGNRGCEALVRSTVELLKAEFGNVEVLIPSFRPDLDSKQWPEAKAIGCRFVRAMPFPGSIKWWGRARRILPFVKDMFFPNYSLPKDILEDIQSCDAMLVIGGDNITIDYGIESLLWHVRLAQHAQRLGKVVMVWGASIGPFSSEPKVENFVADFLRSVDCVTVRETITQQYLQRIGAAANVTLVADGAFVMTPEVFDVSGFWPEENGGDVLGFNISPLIQKFRPADESHEVLQREVASFLSGVLLGGKASVLLVPHVDPLDGSAENSDSHYMNEILTMVGHHGGRIRIAPSSLNAAQLKYVLSRCSYFMGARTHATIGAMSCLVPTVSIAYSIKAKGLNRDLFGDESVVLETQKVSEASLKQFFDFLVQNKSSVTSVLKDKIPEWRVRARVSATKLNSCLRGRSESL